MPDDIQAYVRNIHKHRGFRWALLAAILLGGGIGLLFLLLWGAP